MSSAVRSVPESVGGVVSRSCSNWAEARCGSSAARTQDASSGTSRARRPSSDSPSACSADVVPKSALAPGSHRAAARTPGPPPSRWWGSRRSRPRGGPRPRGRCRGRSGPRAASWVPPRARVRAGPRGPLSDSRPTRPPGGHARCAVGHVRGGRACAGGGGVARSHVARRRGPRGGPASRSASTPTASNGPLAGDLGAMGVYLGLVSAAAAAVRASGRELPERIPVGDALLLTVATFRLARRIAKDPVTAPIRAPFTRFEGASGHAEVAEEVREHGGVKHAVGELLTCPFCLAQWVGTGFVFGYVTAPQGHPAGGADDDDGRGLRRPAVRVRRHPERRARAARPRASNRRGLSVRSLSSVRGRPGAADLPRRPARSYPVILTRTGSSSGWRPVREGAACDRSGAGPCRSASSASA